MVELWRAFLALTWPADCPVCRESVEDTGLCPECVGLVEPRGGPRCRSCDAAGAPVCARCARQRPAFERAWGVFDYAGPIGDAIRAAKYHRRPDALAAVGEQVLRWMPLPLLLDPPEVVVPVALHPRRVAERGLHPPTLLARRVAWALDRPCRPRLLRRVRATAAQAGLDDAGRRRNLLGAFTATPVPDFDVLLVDDVMTTGATFGEAARTLRGAGARRVRALAAAQVGRWA